MKINASEISNILQEQIKDYEQKVNITEEGTVLSVGDGIALVYGLKTMAGELLNFPDADNVKGMVLNLEEDNVGVAILRTTIKDTEGQKVTSTGKIVSIPVGPALLGRVVHTRRTVDGKGPLQNPDGSPLK